MRADAVLGPAELCGLIVVKNLPPSFESGRAPARRHAGPEAHRVGLDRRHGDVHAVVGRERAAAVLAIYRSWFCFFVVDLDLLPLGPVVDFVVVVAVIPGPVLPHNSVGRRRLVARIAPEEFRDVHGWTFPTKRRHVLLPSRPSVAAPPLITTGPGRRRVLPTTFPSFPLGLLRR